MSRSVQILLFEVFFFQVVLLVKNSWCLQRLSLVTTKRCKATNKVLKSLKWILLLLLCFYRAIFATFFWQRGGFILLATAAPFRTNTGEKKCCGSKSPKKSQFRWSRADWIEDFCTKTGKKFFWWFSNTVKTPLTEVVGAVCSFSQFFPHRKCSGQNSAGKKIVSNAQKEEKYDIKIT